MFHVEQFDATSRDANALHHSSDVASIDNSASGDRTHARGLFWPNEHDQHLARRGASVESNSPPITTRFVDATAEARSLHGAAFFGRCSRSARPSLRGCTAGPGTRSAMSRIGLEHRDQPSSRRPAIHVGQTSAGAEHSDALGRGAFRRARDRDARCRWESARRNSCAHPRELGANRSGGLAGSDDQRTVSIGASTVTHRCGRGDRWPRTTVSRAPARDCTMAQNCPVEANRG